MNMWSTKQKSKQTNKQKQTENQTTEIDYTTCKSLYVCF